MFGSLSVNAVIKTLSKNIPYTLGFIIMLKNFKWIERYYIFIDCAWNILAVPQRISGISETQREVCKVIFHVFYYVS